MRVRECLCGGAGAGAGAGAGSGETSGDFCFTSKLDGERMLLYINNEGITYLISNRMVFSRLTGDSDKKLTDLANSIFDGEFIPASGSGNAYYYAFDIPFLNG